MSWFKTVAFLGLFAVTACGYQPVLVEGAAATSFTNNVSIDAKDGREDFEFRSRLIDRLGQTAGSSRYLLNYNLEITESVVTVSADSSIDRYTFLGNVVFELINNETATVVYSDRVRASSGYSATAETFPTRIAERDARTRLVQSLADQLIQVIQLNADAIVK